MRTILSPRLGLNRFPLSTPGLRPGLHSAAASRLKSGSTLHRGSQIRVLTQTLTSWDTYAAAARLKSNLVPPLGIKSNFVTASKAE